MRQAAGFLVAIFLVRAALGVLFQAPGAAEPALVPAFGLDWTGFGTLVGLFWLPGLVLVVPIGLAARWLSDRLGVLIGLGLLVAGGLASAAAGSVAMLYAGRLMMGTGTVLAILLLTKIVQERFKGPDLFPAMAVYILGWPVGIAAAQALLPPVAVAHGWQWPFLVGAAAMGMAWLALTAASRSGTHATQPRKATGWLTRREVGLMCVAGACWAMINGTYMVLVTFAQPLLVSRGLSVAEAGFATSLMSWINVLAVPAGAILARRPRLVLPMVLGCVPVAAALAASLPFAGLGWAAPILLLHGLFYALPLTIFSALPALGLPPERRAQGLSVYFAWFYAGCTGFPPLAGWLADLSGGAVLPVLFAAGLLVAALGLFLGFRRMVARQGG